MLPLPLPRHPARLTLLTLACLSAHSAFAEEPPTPLVTSSLTIDYAGTAKLGDWISIETDVQKVGKSLAFANCYFVVESVRIARASAVFSVLSR